MDLREIEEKADELLEQMYREVTGPAGAAEMRDVCTRMDVLERAARIKSTVAFRKEREDELMRMKNVFKNQPLVTYPRYPGYSAGVTAPATPTKPAVDRLHELVSYCKQNAEAADAYAITPDEHQVVAEAKAYRDAATKLEEILREGSL